MYREETRKRIERAMAQVLAREGLLPGFVKRDQHESEESAILLARVLSDQLWFDGYELALVITHSTAYVS
jgi:hypothetical protein